MKKPKKWNVYSRCVSAWRKVWRYSPTRKEALKRQTRANGLIECEKCHEEVPPYAVDVDHTLHVVPFAGFDSWDAVHNRLFCDSGSLHVLCKPCHSTKTAKEKVLRKKAKALKVAA